MKKILYIDMDNVLVDFPSGVSKLSQEVIKVDFTPHDLRRTVSTMMTSMGIPLLTVSKILNHAKGGVTDKHYDHYAYDKEKKEALTKWGKKVAKICGDK